MSSISEANIPTVVACVLLLHTVGAVGIQDSETSERFLRHTLLISLALRPCSEGLRRLLYAADKLTPFLLLFLWSFFLRPSTYFLRQPRLFATAVTSSQTPRDL